MLNQRYALTGCLITLVAFLQCGCEIATIEEPVGEPWSLKETKAIEGQWLAPNGDSLELAVVSKGDVRMGSLNWDSKKMEFVATTERYQFRHVGKFDFVFSDVPDQAKPRYFLARIQLRTDDTITWQWPNEKLVLEAIRNGKLPGVLEKIENRKELHPHLKCSGDELLKWIEETGDEAVFPKVEDESDFILTKVKKPERKTP